jgi:hypothetical protein
MNTPVVAQDSWQIMMANRRMSLRSNAIKRGAKQQRKAFKPLRGVGFSILIS